MDRLNQLYRDLPEGKLVDTGWLKAHGYSRQLWNHYVASGRLEQPVRGVFRRPRGPLTWQEAVVSLQTALQYPLTVGGRTALELQGYAHYLPQNTTEVHLYGPKAPPAWLAKLKLAERFIYHNDRALFGGPSDTPVMAAEKESGKDNGDGRADMTVQPWGQWNWPLMLSMPERALLELLDELPTRESFHQVDKLMEGLPSLSPRRLQELLERCKSVKVKRLFFFFADRHQHAWLKRLDKSAIDLGKGKRMLVRGGKLDHTYQITVPEDLDAVR
jgi:transcriptional regulator with AbiEi antitoxin domain of type IV toxin-antitoxin system